MAARKTKVTGQSTGEVRKPLTSVPPETPIIQPSGDNRKPLVAEDFTDLRNDYAKQISDVEQKLTEQFDKNLLTLSTAAIGVSMSFLPKSGNPDHELLFASWLCFGIVVTLTIFSYFVGSAGLKLQFKLSEEYLANPRTTPYPDVEKNPFNIWQRRMSWAAALLFIGGIILTALFIGKGL